MYYPEDEVPFVDTITGVPYRKLYYMPMSCLIGDSNDFVWMQSTGRKDKNGIEIYKDDILGYPNPNSWGVVKRGEYEFGEYDTYESGDGFYLCGSKNGSFRTDVAHVIGNIHEHPYRRR